MVRLNDITEKLITAVVVTDDLNDGLYTFQKAIGIDYGDVAARVFAFGWDDEWPTATHLRRREMMDHYIELERLEHEEE